MSETKHTPGPWELEVIRDPIGIQLFTVSAPNGLGMGGCLILNDVVIEGAGDEEEMLNARLIAAAPELLDALKRLAGHGDCFGHIAGEVNPYQQAISAIAKAEGRS